MMMLQSSIEEASTVALSSFFTTAKSQAAIITKLMLLQPLILAFMKEQKKSFRLVSSPVQLAASADNQLPSHYSSSLLEPRGNKSNFGQ